MFVRIFDCDGSVSGMPCFDGWTPRIVAGRDLEAGLRLWGTRRAMRQATKRLAADVISSQQPTLTFWGSGDFHHLTPLLLAEQTTPLTLIHFDNHPDWVRWPPKTHCGSWINRALALPHVEKVITLGPSGDDLTRPDLKGGNMAAIKSGRLELYPWTHSPSRLVDGTKHAWTELATLHTPEQWLSALFQRLPTSSVWVSIDKDVLRPDEALTNWDQGQMSLDFLEMAVRLLASWRHVVGADICGDYSPAHFPSLIKRFSAWMDHPAQKHPPSAAELERNVRTNARLLRIFNDIFTERSA